MAVLAVTAVVPPLGLLAAVWRPGRDLTRLGAQGSTQPAKANSSSVSTRIEPPPWMLETRTAPGAALCMDSTH